MDRRTFLSLAAAVAAPAATRLPIKKGVFIGMLPKDLPLSERFAVAREAGFEEIECVTTADEREAEAIKKAAEGARLRIHSVMNEGHWQYPLSSSDAAVVAKSVAAMQTSLRNAHLWGADTVLLVPAVVNPQTGYQEAWTRSQAVIRRELLPLAEKLKVVIGIEEVWNKFLLSPLEMVRYVDEFQSRWVRAYLDVGNMVLFGYPQDWIRTLGKRTVKVHLKDFRFKGGRTEWTALREGDIDWKAVHQAFAETGYSGTATVELPAGDLAYLKEVSRRVDLILEGA